LKLNHPPTGPATVETHPSIHPSRQWAFLSSCWLHPHPRSRPHLRFVPNPMVYTRSRSKRLPPADRRSGLSSRRRGGMRRGCVTQIRGWSHSCDRRSNGDGVFQSRLTLNHDHQGLYRCLPELINPPTNAHLSGRGGFTDR